MGIESNLDLHFWITRGMARRMGVNLTKGVQEGDLTRADVAAMVTACRTCGRSEFCLALLSERGPAPNALPADCPNKPALESLRIVH
ncbi:DUF6455 family protein [Thioclava sp.]|uniref:DUF6455 family protein n=1 Tax=Thioclava sp. TaxID=1933450 RepID=UPI003AA7ABC7